MNSASPRAVCRSHVRCDRGQVGWHLPIGMFGLTLAVLLATFRDLPAETKQVPLPASYADFAINPDTGDLAAVDSSANSITLFRRAYLKGDKKAVVGPVIVGKSAVSICFKRFADKSYFAVVCEMEPNLYLLDAAQLTLTKKIALAHKHHSHVTCSQNSQDPFVYYSFGRGDGAAVGAVNLRAMSDQGQVFDDTEDFAVSASGTMIYRHGTASPSGLCALRLVSGFEDSKPNFVLELTKHEESEAYLPDPFDLFTAVGSEIYSRDLSGQAGKLDFTPACFLRNRPVILGMTIPDGPDSPDRGNRSREDRPKTAKISLELKAASYNTWGTTASLPISLTVTKASGGSSEETADDKYLAWQAKVLGDEKNGVALLAILNQVVEVPLADLKLKDEPFLQLRTQGTENLIVGKKATLKFEKFDTRATLEWEGLPEGAKSSGGTLDWTPTAEQVGKSQLVAILKHGTLERRQLIPVDIVVPSVTLPFQAERVAIDSTGKWAVCWTVLGEDNNGGRRADRRETWMAVVDVSALKVVAEKKLPFAAGAVALTSDMLFASDETSLAVEVIKPASLERIKLLQAESQVASISVYGGKTVVFGSEGTYVSVSLPALERIQVDRPDERLPADQMTLDALRLPGPWLRGVLMDESATSPQLLVSPSGFLKFETRSDQHERFMKAQREFEGRSPKMRGRIPAEFEGGEIGGHAELSAISADVILEIRSHQERDHGDWPRERFDLSLRLSDVMNLQKKLSVPLASVFLEGEQRRHVEHGLAAAQKTVVAIFGNRLYRWTAGELKPMDFPNPVRIAPRQPVFALEPKGQTQLKHVAKGGKAPYEFALEGSLTGASIDPASGTLTIDPSALVPKVQALLIAEGIMHLDGENDASPVDSLRKYSVKSIDPFTKLVGRKPIGVPIAVPIHVRVTDADGGTDELQYSVFAEVPFKPVAEALEKRQSEAEEKKVAKPLTQPDEARPTANAAELRKKIEALEARIDLMARELGRLGKLLNEKENPPEK